MIYLDEINRSMRFLANNPHVIFVGQAVEYPGTALTHQIKDLNTNKLEFPVAEDFQAGFCLGLALEGYIPVCIYPRFNFALLACNQIVNHIDKWPLISDGKSTPKIIIKIAIGSAKPLDPGWQHKGNYTNSFRLLCDTIDVIELKTVEQIFPAYELALNRTDGRSTIIIEHSDKYACGPLWEK